ncbi:DUF2239 family protein [Bdellovibrio sp. SKB1291214]|uniref:DUF2239 family protein n=1 Tax=Bdellovibrio sp. SKB1291214 TaxID=1732569 RepID=UPI000B69141B|nr:DUF2239 family protein [Bdellovibrio sp. SKB1291214]UYL09637.1 DUF2239 family protein [Bdellovibrio sp. SKB1291214]
MGPRMDRTCTAFAGTKIIASGDVLAVALKVKKYLKDGKENVLIFDDVTSAQVELDLRGTVEAVTKRLEAMVEPEEKKSGPGRPKLGVVSKEVTLLPQHWEWLSLQPGGASVTLRKLIEEAKKKNFAKDQIRQAQEAVYKFMHAMAGDLPNYEEALRAMYANDAKKFKKMIADWPKDIQEHALKVGQQALANIK